MASKNPKAFLFRKKTGKAKKALGETVGTPPSWVGIVVFGQVQIPMYMRPATTDKGTSLVMLDKTDMALVGRRAYNKATDKNVSPDNVVKGVQVAQDQYVVLDREDLLAALPLSTGTLLFEQFIRPSIVEPTYFSNTYYLSPQVGSEKAYAVIQAALLATGLGGVGRVMISTKQHTAMAVADKLGIKLHLLRSPSEVKKREVAVDTAPVDPASVKDINLAKRAMRASSHAVWAPHLLPDDLHDKLVRVAERKVAAPGQPIKALEEWPSRLTSSRNLTLTEQLKLTVKAL